MLANISRAIQMHWTGLSETEENVDARRTLAAQIGAANTLEDAIRIVQRAVKERDFFFSVGDARRTGLDADASGLQRTALAEAAVTLLVPRVLADFSTRFGRVRGGSLAVVAMGKAGGRGYAHGRLGPRPDVRV